MITFKAKTDNGSFLRSTFSQMTFPAGEAHLKMDPTIGIRDHEIAIVQFTPESMHADLFALEMWMQAIDIADLGTRTSVLMPYLPGARADKGSPRGAASYSLFVANLGMDDFVTADPHSDGWMQYFRIAQHGYSNLNTAVHTLMPEYFIPSYILEQYDGIIAPDEGASRRAAGVARSQGIPLYTATKERDFESGKLLKFNPPTDLPEHGSFLIVDDICDGGGTFLGLAKALSPDYPHSYSRNLSLYVTHGVFSKDARHDLAVTFENIYTTNSFNPDQKRSHSFTTIDILPDMLDYI